MSKPKGPNTMVLAHLSDHQITLKETRDRPVVACIGKQTQSMGPDAFETRTPRTLTNRWLLLYYLVQ